VLALGVGLSLAAPALAQNQKGKGKGFQKVNPAFLRTNPTFLAAFRDVVARPSLSTVRVRCDNNNVALGTIVAADGWVLTKAGDLKGNIAVQLWDNPKLPLPALGASTVALLPSGLGQGPVVAASALPGSRTFEARVVGVHEAHDLAMLKIDAKGLVPVEWRSSKEDAVGYWVASVGLANEPAAVGVIGVAARHVAASKLPQVRVSGAGGYLGVLPEPTDSGVKIAEVTRGTAAAKAGLKVNDIILAVAGKAVADEQAFRKMLLDRKPGDVVALRVKRGDEELELEAKLGKRPPNRADIQNNMGSQLSKRRIGFPDFLQHDSVVLPNDCGGPLVDLDGKVIGINIARAGRTESYAVPAEVIQPLLADLMSGRLAPPMAKAEAGTK
jgi:serine protease Do